MHQLQEGQMEALANGDDSSGAGVEKQKRSVSSFVDISKRSDLNNIIRGREGLTSDLAVYDRFIQQLKHDVKRTEEDPPFHEGVWSLVREALELAAVPLGFQELPDEGSCQLKSSLDAMQLVGKCQSFWHIVPIHPNILADKAQCSVKDVLTEMFYATKIGLVDMIWAPSCERCGGSACQTSSLGELPKEAHCGSCGFKNVVSYLDNVKVYFVLHPEVLYFPVTSFECAHSSYRKSKLLSLVFAFPTSTKSGFSYEFGMMDENKSKPLLRQGLYRIFCPFSMSDCYLQVDKDAGDKDEQIVTKLKVSELLRPRVGKGRTQLCIPHGKVRFEIFCDTFSTACLHFLPDMDDESMLVPREEERTAFTSASICVHHPSFKRMFEKQIVSDMSSFAIQRVVLVFTDVVGSTALYESHGDGVALRAVKEHFKVLFTAFASSGRVVKTVGDCVMASFTSGEAAISAVAKGLEGIQEHCLLPDGTPLAIRVGMHCGPVLMVALNGINDYFGSTVNIAARVESKADAHECLVTGAVLSEPGAAAAFDDLAKRDFMHSRDVELSLKGVESMVEAKGLKLHGESY